MEVALHPLSWDVLLNRSADLVNFIGHHLKSFYWRFFFILVRVEQLGVARPEGPKIFNEFWTSWLFESSITVWNVKVHLSVSWNRSNSGVRKFNKINNGNALHKAKELHKKDVLHAHRDEHRVVSHCLVNATRWQFTAFIPCEINTFKMEVCRDHPTVTDLWGRLRLIRKSNHITLGGRERKTRHRIVWLSASRKAEPPLKYKFTWRWKSTLLM